MEQLDAQEVRMAKKTRVKARKPVKDLAARGRKAAGVKGGVESLTTATISKDEFLAQFRGGTTTTSSTTTPSTTTSRSTPTAFSS
jgi:hypothetical protein